MNIMKLFMLAGILLIAGAAQATSQPAAVPDAQSAQQRYEAREHYRFNLGGPYGEYTDWERMDLDGFDGLATTIQIDKAYGKPEEKWASIARINLYAAGSLKDRQLLSIIFTVDRKSHRIQPAIYRSKDKPEEAFDVHFDLGKPIDLTIVPGGPGKLLFAFGKQSFEVPCDLDIKALSVVGSGVDVKFEPFNLLRRVSP